MSRPPFSDIPPGPTLRTDRLLLRRPVAGDAAAIARLLDNWNVARWLARVPFPYTEDDAADWIAQAGRRWDEGSEHQFSIVLVEGTGADGAAPVLVGQIGLRLSDGRRTAELGYWLGEPHWGRGYGTEAARAVLAHGFERLGLDAVVATSLPDNGRSLRVLAKAGLVPAGTRRQEFATRGAAFDVPLLMLGRDAWRAARASGAPTADGAR